MVLSLPVIIFLTCDAFSSFSSIYTISAKIPPGTAAYHHNTIAQSHIADIRTATCRSFCHHCKHAMSAFLSNAKLTHAGELNNGMTFFRSPVRFPNSL